MKMTINYLLLWVCFCLITNSSPKYEKHYAFSDMKKEQAIEVQKAAEEYFKLPMNIEIKLNDTISIEFVLIPPGEFMMGSKRPSEELVELYGGKASEYELEYPQHSVKISKPFYMSVYEITQLQWSALMEKNPSPIQGLDLPVGDLSWDQCKDFCEMLSEKIGKKIRLPTEAEWEFTCRAGTTTEFYFGDGLTKEQANFNNESAVPVGTYPSNCWGLFDMHGNVLEWVEDAYYFYTDGFQIDPLNTEHQFGRMYRGGFYSGDLKSLRSARRVAHLKSKSYEFYGFRVVYQID